MNDPRGQVAPPYAPAPDLRGPSPRVPAGGPMVPAGGLDPMPPDAEAPGVGAGVSALFSGLKFVTSMPSVWPLAMVPAIFVLAITATVAVLGYEILPEWILPMLGPWASKGHGAVGVVVRVVLTALSLVVGLGLGFALAQPLSGTALEKIVRKVEASLHVPSWPETSIAQEIWRSLEGVLLTAALSVPILAMLFVLELIFPPVAIVTTPLKLVVTAMMLAWDLCDYPLSIRGMAIRDRVAFIRRHLGAVFGFGIGLGLLSLIPCALLLALPIGAAGATRLIVRLERWDRLNPKAP